MTALKCPFCEYALELEVRPAEDRSTAKFDASITIEDHIISKHLAPPMMRQLAKFLLGHPRTAVKAEIKVSLGGP